MIKAHVTSGHWRRPYWGCLAGASGGNRGALSDCSEADPWQVAEVGKEPGTKSRGAGARATFIPGAQGTGPGLATVSVTLCRVRVKPSSSLGGREAGQLLWVLGQRFLSTSLASPRRSSASASLCPLLHPQIPIKMLSLWGHCAGYGPSPVLGKP